MICAWLCSSTSTNDKNCCVVKLWPGLWTCRPATRKPGCKVMKESGFGSLKSLAPMTGTIKGLKCVSNLLGLSPDYVA